MAHDIEGGAQGRAGSSTGAVLAALGVALCPVCFGFTMGFTGTALGALTKPPGEGGVLNSSEGASFTAVATLAAGAGSLLGGSMAERYGRKRSLQIAMMLCAVGSTLIATGGGYHTLLAGRTLCGFAVGAVSVATPLYLTEIAPRHLQGFLGSTMQLAIVSGLLFVFVVGYEVVPTRGWRCLAATGAVIPTCFVLLVAPLLPESPRWLAASKYPDRVQDSLRVLRGLCADVHTAGYQVLDAAIADEGAEMIRDAKRGQPGQTSGEVVVSHSSGRSGIRAVLGLLFASGSDASALRMACAVMSLQQLSGINVVNMFASTILAGAGVEDSQAAAIWLAVTHCVSTTVCMLTSDKLPHRTLLAVSALGMAVAAAMLSVCVQATSDAAAAGTISTKDSDGTAASGCSARASVAALVVYVFSFGVGVGPLGFVIVSTNLPPEILSSGQALSTTLNWTFAFVVTRTFGRLAEVMGTGGVFQVYAIISLGYSMYACTLPNAANAANAAFSQQREKGSNQ